MLKEIFKQTDAPATARGIVRGLKKLGWEESGTKPGYKTRVFVNPHAPSAAPSAVRINTMQDYGFYNYARLCETHPSPHFQNIFEHGFLEDGTTHVALTEQLYRVPPISKAGGTLRSQLQAFWNLANYIFPFASKDGAPMTPDEEFETNYSLWEYNEHDLERYYTALRETSPGLADAVSTVQSCQLWLSSQDPRYTGPFADFSPSNIMIRKGGPDRARTIVLSDPFAYDPANHTFWDRDDRYDALIKVFGEPPQTVTQSFAHRAPPIEP